nr:3-isopropylmalate dehydrogenase [Oceanococcus sp. HetDA_MAG_MS8]
MSVAKLLLLPGDGIGPEIVAQAERVLALLNELSDWQCEWEHARVGGAAYDVDGDPFPEETERLCHAADAILFGAVGGPQYDELPRAQRPESGLLRMRASLDLFANLRPAQAFAELAAASSLKPELVAGLDILIVRELTGGIYFGQPRAQEDQPRRAFNTMVYTAEEIERIARAGFEAARRRQGRLCSVDKANVLEVSQLWRDVVTELSADYPDVSLSHMYVDNAAMQLVRQPKQFDVLVTGNLFGDILSDLAAMLTGSIGMLPSASLNSGGRGLYEPVHGSAPDIAGQDRANPLAMLLSLAMALRHSLNRADLAKQLEQAITDVLASGVRTADIAGAGETPVGTQAMGDAVLAALRHRLQAAQ